MTDVQQPASSAPCHGRKLPREQLVQHLTLFWETAQPLKRILEELPDMEEGLSSRLRIVFPTKGWSHEPTLDDLAHAAVESEMVTTFPNLPEPLFERLALRFRPFFAKGETTFFLKTLALMARQWPEFKSLHRSYKERWHRAVFWGAMGIRESTPPVQADAVIEAGFYSRYFHVSLERRIEAREYETSLGEGMFRVALVSSVWQRSMLVVAIADVLEEILLRNGVLSEESRQRAVESHQQPEHIVLTLKGGSGAIKMTPLPPNTALPEDS